MDPLSPVVSHLLLLLRQRVETDSRTPEVLKDSNLLKRIRPIVRLVLGHH